MTVIAFRTREQIAQDTRAAEMPHRREYPNPTDQKIGSPLGKASIIGLITEAEFAAARSWGKLHSDYMDTIQHPDRFVDEWCEKIATKYNRGIEILDKHPRRVFHAVMALACYGEDWGDLEYTAAAARRGFASLSDEGI